MASSSAASQPPLEYHQFRQLRHPDIDPHLLGIQLDRLLDLESHQGRSGLPNFVVVAPGVVSVTFEHDTSSLSSLGPAIFQLRGRGEVVWTAHEMTPGWRLRELKWYADELSLLDASDIDIIVDSAYIPPVAERSRGRRVTGPSPRTLCSPEPELTVLGRGRYRLAFPAHNGAPEWWAHPVNIDIRDEIIVNHHQDTPTWRFDEIREYVNLLADIHLEAITEDPELIGASVGGRKGTGTLRRSTWSPRAVRKANTADSLAKQMDNLSMESSPISPSGPRRASEPAAKFTPGKSIMTAEPIQEHEAAAVHCEIIGHGTFALTWFDIHTDSSDERWTRIPARVQLMEGGAVLDLHTETPPAVRRQFTSAAMDLYLRLAHSMAEVSSVVALSLPNYPFLDAVLPRPDQIDPLQLAAPSANFSRGIFEIRSRTVPPKVPPADKLPRLVLDEAPRNTFRLRSRAESLTEIDSDQVFDLTTSSSVHPYLSSVPPAQLGLNALYVYALSELAGVRENAPPSIIDMLQSAVPVGQMQAAPPPETKPPSPGPVLKPAALPEDEQKVESSSDLIGVGTFDVTFASLDTTVRVYLVDDDQCHFDLPDHTSVSRVSELTTALEHSLAAELDAWEKVQSVVQQYAPRLPLTELRATLPELEPAMARLTFTPHSRTSTVRTSRDDLPKLRFRRPGIYELEWPAHLRITATRYEINDGKIGLLVHSRTPDRCMVMWLGVVIKTLFESGLSPKSPTLPPLQNPKRASFVPMVIPTVYSPPQSPDSLPPQSPTSQRSPGIVQFPVPGNTISPPLASPNAISPPAIHVAPTAAFPVPHINSRPTSPNRHFPPENGAAQSPSLLPFPSPELSNSHRRTSWHSPVTPSSLSFGSMPFPQPYSGPENEVRRASGPTNDTRRASMAISTGTPIGSPPEYMALPMVHPDRHQNVSPSAQLHLQPRPARPTSFHGPPHTAPANGRFEPTRNMNRSPVGRPYTTFEHSQSTNSSPLPSEVVIPQRTASNAYPPNRAPLYQGQSEVVIPQRTVSNANPPLSAPPHHDAPMIAHSRTPSYPHTRQMNVSPRPPGHVHSASVSPRPMSGHPGHGSPGPPIGGLPANMPPRPPGNVHTPNGMPAGQPPRPGNGPPQSHAPHPGMQDYPFPQTPGVPGQAQAHPNMQGHDHSHPSMQAHPGIQSRPNPNLQGQPPNMQSPPLPNMQSPPLPNMQSPPLQNIQSPPLHMHSPPLPNQAPHPSHPGMQPRLPHIQHMHSQSHLPHPNQPPTSQPRPAQAHPSQPPPHQHPPMHAHHASMQGFPPPRPMPPPNWAGFPPPGRQEQGQGMPPPNMQPQPRGHAPQYSR